MIGLAIHGSLAIRLATDISLSHLKELQRFAEVGRLSAGLIHDMANPLAAAILHLEQGEPGVPASVRQARRSIRVLERYLEAARLQLHQRDGVRIFSVQAELQQARYILMPQAARHGVRLRFHVCPSYTLRGDPVKFQRILTNLVTNAMEAYREAGSFERPRVRVTLSGRRGRLLIRVRDWGPGISPERLPRIFEPFYTTKSADGPGGTGIGLYNVRCYVEDDFGGKLSAVNPAGGGAEFKVELPRRPL